MPQLFRSIICILFFISIITRISQSEEKYLTQFEIDSIIDNTLLDFSNLSDSSNKKTQASIIQNAKSISAKLRSFAQNDINKKYILTKVIELEYQTYLEEHSLTLEKTLWRKNQVNNIIDDFNRIISYTRPDFIYLNDLNDQLSKLDSSLACQTSKLFISRAESFHTLLPDLIEQQLKNNHVDSAYNELAYCHIHSVFLNFSPADLALMEAKFISNTSIAESVKSVSNGFDSLKKNLENNDFLSAHRSESFIRFFINLLKKELTASEWNKYFVKFQIAISKIDIQEDSCISIAQKLINSGRILDAGALIDTLGKKGVNSDKMLIINNKLLESLIAQHHNHSLINIYSYDPDTSETNPVFTEFILAAKSRVLADRDILSKKKEEYSSLTNISEVRKERLYICRMQQQKRDEIRKNSSFQKAYDELVTIFAFLEKDSVAHAKKYFESNRKLLSDNLSAEDLSKLESVLISKTPSADTIIHN